MLPEGPNAEAGGRGTIDPEHAVGQCPHGDSVLLPLQVREDPLLPQLFEHSGHHGAAGCHIGALHRQRHLLAGHPECIGPPSQLRRKFRSYETDPFTPHPEGQKTGQIVPVAALDVMQESHGRYSGSISRR